MRLHLGDFTRALSRLAPLTVRKDAFVDASTRPGVGVELHALGDVGLSLLIPEHEPGTLQWLAKGDLLLPVRDLLPYLGGLKALTLQGGASRLEASTPSGSLAAFALGDATLASPWAWPDLQPQAFLMPGVIRTLFSATRFASAGGLRAFDQHNQTLRGVQLTIHGDEARMRATINTLAASCVAPGGSGELDVNLHPAGWTILSNLEGELSFIVSNHRLYVAGGGSSWACLPLIAEALPEMEAVLASESEPFVSGDNGEIQAAIRRVLPFAGEMQAGLFTPDAQGRLTIRVEREGSEVLEVLERARCSATAKLRLPMTLDLLGALDPEDVELRLNAVKHNVVLAQDQGLRAAMSALRD